MIYKGKVLEVNNDFAIVLTNSMEYLKVKKKAGLLVGNQILFVEDDVYKENSISYKNMLGYAAVLAVMLLSISFIANFSAINNLFTATAAIVSVDINPSVELKVDNKHKVIKATPLTADAHEILSDQLKGLDIEDAVFALILNAKEKQYLTPERNSILISTIAMENNFMLDKENLRQRIEAKLEEEQEIDEILIAYIEGNRKDIREARRQNLSIGKYEIYKKLVEKNQEITVEQLRAMEVQDIFKKGIGQLKVDRMERRLKNIYLKDQEQDDEKEKFETDEDDDTENNRGANIRNDIRENIKNNIKNNIKENKRNNIKDEKKENIEDETEDETEDDIRENIRENIRDRIEEEKGQSSNEGKPINAEERRIRDRRNDQEEKNDESSKSEQEDDQASDEEDEIEDVDEEETDD